LDYPGVGPELSALKDVGRVTYAAVTDNDAVKAAYLLSRLEGIIPALETAHAIAYLDQLMPSTEPGEIIVVNVSGRGDKDIVTLSEMKPGQ
jgi:tryptophan synthase beta chain